MAQETRQRLPRTPLLFLSGTVLIWGTGYWPTEVATEHAPVLQITGLRLATGAVVLLLAVPLMGARLPRGHLAAWALFTGLLMAGLFQWGLTEAIALAGPGNGAVIINTNPLMVLVLAWIFLRERLSMLNILGLLAGFGGVVLMVSSQLGGEYKTRDLLLGCAIALISGLGWAGGVLILRTLANRDEGVDMIGFTAAQYAVASVLFLPLAFAVDGTSSTDWASGGFWASMMWIGPAAAFGVLFFFLALERLAAAKTSSALFLVPAVAVIVEIVRGNAPGALVLAGMFVTVIGVALAVVPREQLAAVVPFVRRRLRGGAAGG